MTREEVYQLPYAERDNIIKLVRSTIRFGLRLRRLMFTNAARDVGATDMITAPWYHVVIRYDLWVSYAVHPVPSQTDIFA